MKRSWSAEELIEHATLLPEELELVNRKVNKEEHSRLGLACLLKYLQFNGCFPNHKHDLPWPIVNFLAQQLDLAPELYLQYDWNSRNLKRHRALLRAALGYRPMDQALAQELSQWLTHQIAGLEETPNELKAKAYRYLRQARIELPAPKQLERLVRSVLHQYEQNVFGHLAQQLSPACRIGLDRLLKLKGSQQDNVESVETTNQTTEANTKIENLFWRELKTDPAQLSLDSLIRLTSQLKRLRLLDLPDSLFKELSPKTRQRLRQRAAVEGLTELKRHPLTVRYTLLAVFCYCRRAELTDYLVEVLCDIVHKVGHSATKRTEREMLRELRTTHKLNRREALLLKIMQAVLAEPDKSVRELIYPLVGGEGAAQELVNELENISPAFRQQVQTRMRESYRLHYRRLLPPLLDTLQFQTHQQECRPILEGLALIKRYLGESGQYYRPDEKVPLDGAVRPSRKEALWHTDEQSQRLIERVGYEMAVLELLREKLRSKEIWVAEASRYQNPAQDLPQDFEAHKADYFAKLGQPVAAQEFITALKQELKEALAKLNQNLPTNPKVKISKRKGGWIGLSPLTAEAEPVGLSHLKAEVARRWGMNTLLDILKETDLRVGFSELFKTATVREHLDRTELQKRLLLCLYGLGTNSGLKRVSNGYHGESYDDLTYVRQRYILKDYLRAAINQVANAIFAIRKPAIWGEDSTTCASDSTLFGTWEGNLLARWHPRYKEKGVLVYWHVEKKAVCIYSQLKSCASSEAAAMLQGLLSHQTSLSLQHHFVDTHGQSEVAFGFCRLLGVELMPRLKNIYAQKLYLAEGEADEAELYPNLAPILKRAINWDLISEHYENLVKYSIALKNGLVEAETLLRCFTSSAPSHSVFAAMAELGKAVKTIFLCRYLADEGLRQEIHQGLCTIES
jgi:TnpA family transposase